MDYPKLLKELLHGLPSNFLQYSKKSLSAAELYYQIIDLCEIIGVNVSTDDYIKLCNKKLREKFA